MLVKNRRRAQTMCCLFSCLALQISKHSLHNTNTLAVCKVYSFIDVVCNRHETDEVHPNTVGRRPLTVHTSHSTGSPDLKPTVWMKHQNGAVGGPSEWGRRPLEADQGPLFLDGPEFVSLIRVRVGLRIQPALGVNGSRVHTTDWLATLPWCRDSKDTQCEYEMLDHWTVNFPNATSSILIMTMIYTHKHQTPEAWTDADGSFFPVSDQWPLTYIWKDKAIFNSAVSVWSHQ